MVNMQIGVRSIINAEISSILQISRGLDTGYFRTYDVSGEFGAAANGKSSDSLPDRPMKI